MVFMRSVALVASALICVATAGSVLGLRQEIWVPGTQNNTREFYITLIATTASLAKYNGWACELNALVLPCVM
jgi:type III secretory pathway component EscS